MVSHLWKNCFYKQIEEFRASIKQRKKLLDDQMNTSGQYASRDKEQLGMLNGEFVRFLGDSISYFTKLMSQVSFTFNAYL